MMKGAAKKTQTTNTDDISVFRKGFPSRHIISTAFWLHKELPSFSDKMNQPQVRGCLKFETSCILNLAVTDCQAMDSEMIRLCAFLPAPAPCMLWSLKWQMAKYPGPNSFSQQLNCLHLLWIWLAVFNMNNLAWFGPFSWSHSVYLRVKICFLTFCTKLYRMYFHLHFLVLSNVLRWKRKVARLTLFMPFKISYTLVRLLLQCLLILNIVSF